jgi:hypothetical protein
VSCFIRFLIDGRISARSNQILYIPLLSGVCVQTIFPQPTGDFGLNNVKRDFKHSRRSLLKFFAVLFSSLGSSSWAFIPTAFFKRKNDLRVPIGVTLTTNTQEYLLNAAAQGGYVAGKSDLTLTINSGVYVWSDNTATAGLTCSGFAAGDTLKIINKGYIIGKGGAGGNPTTAGSPGGPGLDLLYPASIDNSAGYIAGGGGGGGGGGGPSPGGGGGAGGGSGGGGSGGAGVSGGSCGNAGSNGSASNPFGGGAGGRILPGVGGNPVGIQNPGQGGGSGGSGAAQGKGSGGTSGAGGSGSSPGGNADTTNCNAAGGGAGWGATGGWGGQTISPQLYAGGLGGNAIRLNGRSVTWLGNQGNVYGVVT